MKLFKQELDTVFLSSVSRFPFTEIQTLLASRLYNLSLSEVLGDPLQAEDVVRRSYRHSNGFSKVVLKSSEVGWELRVHRWERDTSHAPNIHDHTRDFLSVVLDGEIEVSTYRDDTAGRPHNIYTTSQSADPRAYTLNTTAERRLSCVSRQRYSRGDVHSDVYSTLHRVMPIGVGETITLFVQGPRRKHAAIVATEKSLTTTAMIVESPLTEDEIRATVEAAERSLRVLSERN